jgi:Zn-finger nucleic acid-binding protein
MITFNRHGVHIEQCEGCRGIFLDRGELEQIAHAEQSHYGGAPPYAGGHYADSPRPFHGRPDSPGPYRGGYHSDSPPPYGRHGHRRKRGFLEELFD